MRNLFNIIGLYIKTNKSVAMEEESGINHATLQTFIAESKARLNEILKRLDWDMERTLTTKHAEENEKQRNEVQAVDKEPELPPSCAATNSIVTDVEELRKIVADNCKEIPHKFSHLQLNFTRDQKLAIYEHVVANTVKFTEPEMAVPAVGEDGLTFAQIVAEKKRESKKSRRHRRSKPTHTEEVRAVVDLHMQAFQQYLNTNVDKQKPDVHKCTTERMRDDEKDKRGNSYRQRSPNPARQYNYHRGRSKSHERRSSKSQRHRSRSISTSYEPKDHKHRMLGRSSSKKRKQHKQRSKSRSKDMSKSYSHIRRSRSHKHKHSRRSRSRERGRSPNHTHIRRSRSRARGRSPNHAHSRRSRSRERGRSPNHTHSRQSRIRKRSCSHYRRQSTSHKRDRYKRSKSRNPSRGYLKASPL